MTLLTLPSHLLPELLSLRVVQQTGFPLILPISTLVSILTCPINPVLLNRNFCVDGNALVSVLFSVVATEPHMA